MKKLAVVLFVLFLCSVSYAGVESIGTETKALEVEYSQAVEQSKKLDAENQDLIKITDAWKEAVRVNKEQWGIWTQNVNTWDAELQRQKAECATHNSNNQAMDQAMARHNANKPDPRNRGAVDAYNAEARTLNAQADSINANSQRLNAWGDRLKARKQELLRKQDDLKWSNEQLEKARTKNNEMVLAWTQKKKDLNAKFEDINRRSKELQARLQNECTTLLKDPKTTDEALKLGCGRLFDGSNSNLPTLEQAGIKPPFKAVENK
jgi:chromosome segregation ATPase